MPQKLNLEAERLLQIRKEFNAPDVADCTVDEARNIFTSMPTWLRGESAEVGSVEDLQLDGLNGSFDVRVYTPPEASGPPRPVLVYLHGGGWVIGNVDSHDGVCRHFCRQGNWVVVSVDYRLAPEAQYPTAVEDCWTAMQWVQAHATKWGGDPEKIIVGGDSAGGNLAAVVTHRARDRGGVRIAAQVLIYPATDMTCAHESQQRYGEDLLLTRRSIDWFKGHYLPAGQDLRDPEASPLFADDFRDLPPAVLVTAGFDPLIDEGHAYGEKLSAAGMTVSERCWEGMIHGFVTNLGLMPQAGECLDWIVAEVGRLAENPTAPPAAP